MLQKGVLCDSDFSRFRRELISRVKSYGYHGGPQKTRVVVRTNSSAVEVVSVANNI